MIHLVFISKSADHLDKRKKTSLKTLSETADYLLIEVNLKLAMISCENQSICHIC